MPPSSPAPVLELDNTNGYIWEARPPPPPHGQKVGDGFEVAVVIGMAVLLAAVFVGYNFLPDLCSRYKLTALESPRGSKSGRKWEVLEGKPKKGAKTAGTKAGAKKAAVKPQAAKVKNKVTEKAPLLVDPFEDELPRGGAKGSAKKSSTKLATDLETKKKSLLVDIPDAELPRGGAMKSAKKSPTKQATDLETKKKSLLVDIPDAELPRGGAMKSAKKSPTKQAVKPKASTASKVRAGNLD